MNGRRYFLDTNAIVQILSGNRELLALLMDAEYVATSVICELEFLSFPLLLEEDAALFSQFSDAGMGPFSNKILNVTFLPGHFAPYLSVKSASITSSPEECGC